MTEDARTAAVDAVAQFVQQVEPGAMPGKFILVVETFGPDGEPGLWKLAPPGQKRWDTLGLVDEVRLQEWLAGLAG